MTAKATHNQNSNELYDCLPEEICEKLKRYEEIKVCPAGMQLINQSVHPQHLIFLIKGSVEISVPAGARSIALAVAGNGKVFGLRPVVSGALPEINVTCLEESTVALVPRQEFIDTLEQCPQMYFAVAKVLSGDLRMADNLLRHMPRGTLGGARRSNHHIYA
jgi:CRP-like cAMP-binding protein